MKIIEMFKKFQTEETPAPVSELSPLADIEAKNKALKERKEKERAEHNKEVLEKMKNGTLTHHPDSWR